MTAVSMFRSALCGERIYFGGPWIIGDMPIEYIQVHIQRELKKK